MTRGLHLAVSYSLGEIAIWDLQRVGAELSKLGLDWEGDAVDLPPDR